MNLPNLSSLEILRNVATIGNEANDLFAISITLPNGNLDTDLYESILSAVHHNPSVLEAERLGWIVKRCSPMRLPDVWWVVGEKGNEILNGQQGN